MLAISSAPGTHGPALMANVCWVCGGRQRNQIKVRIFVVTGQCFSLRNIILCHSVSVVALTVREISAVKNCSWHRRLTSIADWPVTIYTACWLGNECVNDLPKVLLGVERLGAKPVTHDLLVASLGCWTVPGYNAERVTVVCDCCFFPVIPPIIMSYLEKGAFLKVSCSWCQWHLDSFEFVSNVFTHFLSASLQHQKTTSQSKHCLVLSNSSATVLVSSC